MRGLATKCLDVRRM